MQQNLSIEKIYAPVQRELVTVEHWLESVAQVDYPPLSQMLVYSLGEGGKRIRPALVLLAGTFYHYNLELLLPMATAVELLHTATLVHDDAIDSSAVRRGRPTINVTWDVDKAILFGDFLFAKAEEFTSRTANIRVIRLCAETLQVITAGELNQAFNAFNIKQNYQEYLRRIAAKTASLLATTTESGAILSEAPETSIHVLKEYGYNLGIAFQLVDDILDFVGTESELGKPVGSDLAQGTLTLPAMLLAERYPSENPVQRLFANPLALENIPLAIDMVRNSDIVERCYEVAMDYHRKACSGLAELPTGVARDALQQLADFVVARRR